MPRKRRRSNSQPSVCKCGSICNAYPRCRHPDYKPPQRGRRTRPRHGGGGNRTA